MFGLVPHWLFQLDHDLFGTNGRHPRMGQCHVRDFVVAGPGRARQDILDRSRQCPGIGRAHGRAATTTQCQTFHVFAVSNLQAARFTPLSHLQSVYFKNGSSVCIDICYVCCCCVALLQLVAYFCCCVPWPASHSLKAGLLLDSVAGLCVGVCAIVRFDPSCPWMNSKWYSHTSIFDALVPCLVECILTRLFCTT